MLNALSLSLLGLVLGIRHALDPDHLVAIGTIASRSSSVRRAAGVGALWGIGHTLTLLAVGGAIVTLRITVPPRAGLAMEFAVALMLMVLGVTNLVSARTGRTAMGSAARPLIVGMVHGMAGSAAIALLVLPAVPVPSWALGYLLLFGLGTIAGMLLVTGFVALPASIALARATLARRWLTAVSGVVSLVFGLVMARGLSGPNGLFSAAPIWFPR